MSELNQLKKEPFVCLIIVISNYVCKGLPYRCYILKFIITALPIFSSGSKIDKKGTFFSLAPQEPIEKKWLLALFHPLQTNVIAR